MIRQREREIGLVIICTYLDYANDSRTAQIRGEKLDEKKIRFETLHLKYHKTLRSA